MGNTIVRIFDHLDQAVEARRQLLEAGIAPDSLDLVSRDDEAGPVEGNFVSGNSDTSLRRSATRMRIRPMISKLGGDDQTYEKDFRRASQRGTVMLTVDAADDRQAAMASEVMQRTGGADAARFDH